jgi:hypothetical protein
MIADIGLFMKRVHLFQERVNQHSEDIVFAGFIEADAWIKDEDRRLSRAHRETNRIHGIYGIHPTLSSSETQGRYWIVYETDRMRFER